MARKSFLGSIIDRASCAIRLLLDRIAVNKI